MKRTGNMLATLLCLLLLAGTSGLRAELIAEVDRSQLAMGETLRLTVSADANEDINQLSLRPLLQDFDILQRSTSSKTSIVNGRRTSTRTVELELSPKREGTLKIPPLRTGAATSNFLYVAVKPLSASSAGDPQVRFEAELDRSTVYVQGQAILTLRILQAVNLDARSVTELQLENAFVKPLEQKAFNRTINGQTWGVHEIRYAIFPEQSGDLVIPGQSFSARESRRRGIFDRANTGPLVRRATAPITLKVEPRPSQFPGSTWLPATDVTIVETWSVPPEQLQAGESATRTVTISADGLQGAQLPPINFDDAEGLKFYPDQAVIADVETGHGLRGSRQDSAALVPTRAGSWQIPEVRIPWWDVISGEVRYATLPARTVTVSAASGNTTQSFNAPQALAPSVPLLAPPTTGSSTGPWMLIAIGTSLGWLLTLVYLWLNRSKKEQQPASSEAPIGEKQAFKKLLAACSAGNAEYARSGVINWARQVLSKDSIHSLEQVTSNFADSELGKNLQQLNGHLYSPQTEAWDGAALLEVVQRLRKASSEKNHNAEAPLQLYPTVN